MTISVFGFGSYFKGANVSQDIDILIVHSSTDYNSCLEAISLKKAIVQEIGNADVSILSKTAELEFDFIQKAQAILIAEFIGSYRKSALIEIFQKVHAYKNITRRLNE